MQSFALVMCLLCATAMPVDDDLKPPSFSILDDETTVNVERLATRRAQLQILLTLQAMAIHQKTAEPKTGDNNPPAKP